MTRTFPGRTHGGGSTAGTPSGRPKVYRNIGLDPELLERVQAEHGDNARGWLNVVVTEALEAWVCRGEWLPTPTCMEER